jgi:uncharacterized protein (TIRG00374 family)
LKTFLKLIVTVALIALILWQIGGVAPLVAAFQNVRWPFVVALILIMVVDRAFKTYKWLLLLRPRGVDLKYAKALTVYCVASFWGQVLPMTVGGDVVRLWLTTRLSGRFAVVAASIAMERVLGFVAALLAALVGMLILDDIIELSAQRAQLWWAGVAVIVAGIFTFWLSLSQRLFDALYGALPASLANRKIVQRLRELHEAYLDYRDYGGALRAFFALSLLEQVGPIVFVWLAARAIGVELDILVAAAVVPLATLITRVPISLAGIGVFEGMFMLLLPLGGVAAADAVSMALLDRVVQIVAMAPWWLAMALATKSAKLPDVMRGEPRAPS